MRERAPPLVANALLQLMWLASPALPVGGFSYSEGLEAAVDAGIANDEAKAREAQV
jgi:urease accessory protein